MFGSLGQAARENNKRLAIYKSAYRVGGPMGMVVSDPFLGGGKWSAYLPTVMKMFLMYCIY